MTEAHVTPPEREFDLIVIGLGPAGEKGAAQAAYFGKRVAAVEAGAVGGAVVNTGTLPSKTLRETALYLSGLRSRNLYGIDYTFSRAISVSDLFYREKLVTRAHLDLVEENLARHGITVLHGRAALEDARTVAVRDASGGVRRLRAECILLATGSRPARPAGVPFDGACVFDTDSVLGIQRIPRSLIVVGAGVIGSEYATLFAALGSDVTLLDRGDRLLPFLDAEIAQILVAQMEQVGVRIRFGCRMQSIARDPGGSGAVVSLADGSVLRAEGVLYCAGRIGNTDGLGLERVGIVPDGRGRIAVDEHYRTAVPTILAAGDVIGFPALASTSMEQARVAVCQAFGFAYKRQVSSLIPYGLYTIPEVSMVGESEDSLRASGTPYLVGRGFYGRNARAQIIGDTTGLIKLLFDPDSRRVLGVHIVGERASELIHVGQMCMQFAGTIDAFIENVFNFPTIADAYKYAAYDGLQALERWQSGEAAPAPPAGAAAPS
ncbi:MAG TPA: Si-specific NAD(P)(+) transhydrogenase [Dehalococcoidia bacterium]|nr:Si-specific NAD(P)(+) transhydrogenase [Dehalococcoidia bacterium]